MNSRPARTSPPAFLFLPYSIVKERNSDGKREAERSSRFSSNLSRKTSRDRMPNLVKAIPFGKLQKTKTSKSTCFMRKQIRGRKKPPGRPESHQSAAPQRSRINTTAIFKSTAIEPFLILFCALHNRSPVNPVTKGLVCPWFATYCVDNSCFGGGDPLTHPTVRLTIKLTTGQDERGRTRRHHVTPVHSFERRMTMCDSRG
jgi:hypothetical protein